MKTSQAFQSLKLKILITNPPLSSFNFCFTIVIEFFLYSFYTTMALRIRLSRRKKTIKRVLQAY